MSNIKLYALGMMLLIGELSASYKELREVSLSDVEVGEEVSFQVVVRSAVQSAIPTRQLSRVRNSGLLNGQNPWVSYLSESNKVVTGRLSEIGDENISCIRSTSSIGTGSLASENCCRNACCTTVRWLCVAPVAVVQAICLNRTIEEVEIPVDISKDRFIIDWIDNVISEEATKA